MLHGDFKYFVFSDLQKLAQSPEARERLAITVMAFVGQGYFCVAVGDAHTQRVPHIEDSYDWASKGAYLELTKEQVD